jgi:hypothetical protein
VILAFIVDGFPRISETVPIALRVRSPQSNIRPAAGA